MDSHGALFVGVDAALSARGLRGMQQIEPTDSPLIRPLQYLLTDQDDQPLSLTLFCVVFGDQLLLNLRVEGEIHKLALNPSDFVTMEGPLNAGRSAGMWACNLDLLKARLETRLLHRAVPSLQGSVSPDLFGIPPQALGRSLGWLDASSLARFSCCSRRAGMLSQEPDLWLALLQRDFPSTVLSLSGITSERLRNTYVQRWRARIHQRRMGESLRAQVPPWDLTMDFPWQRPSPFDPSFPTFPAFPGAPDFVPRLGPQGGGANRDLSFRLP